MRLLLLVLGLPLVAAPAPDAVLKIVTVQEHMEGPPWRTTEYLSPEWRRVEFRNIEGRRTSPSGPTTYEYGPRMAMISRCDRGLQFEMNLDAREYTTAPISYYPFNPPGRKFTKVERVFISSSAPTLSIEVITKDTGERKQVFGRTARHVITVQKQTPSEASLGQAREMTTDGWYIDLEDSLRCEEWYGSTKRGAAYAHLETATVIKAGARPLVPRVTFKETGAPEQGFPIEQVTTHSEWPSRGMSKKVVELSSVPFDRALFEVPSGFYHANRWDRALLKEAAYAWQRAQTQMRQYFGLN